MEQDSNPGGIVRGVFGKLPGAESVKSRLQTRLSRTEAEHFYMASLVDTLETASRVLDHPVLFLPESRDVRLGAKDALFAAGLRAETWDRLAVKRQEGEDLGERLERALDFLIAEYGGGLIIGSDSPSLNAGILRRGLALLARADLVLGPARDGGYYALGLRQRRPHLLQGIPWSTNRVFAETRGRAEALGLQVALLEPWMDVDRPEDLEALAHQIVALRAAGDAVTARHTARVLAELGIVA
jgi:rSAM/selenodomain-associated transferase 1